MRLTDSALYLLLLATRLVFSQSPEGTISGTVLDERSQPIADAQVCVIVSHPPSFATQCFGHTDSTGQFQIQHFPMGTYRVTASKNEDGYPEIEDTNALPTATLTPAEPLARVMVKLGPQTGILVPIVKDKVTGKRIFQFQVHWMVNDPDHPNSGVGGGGAGFSPWTTRTWLPAGKDIALEVSARGYKKWVYSDGSKTQQPMQLRLQSGEQKYLNVELEPEAKTAPADH